MNKFFIIVVIVFSTIASYAQRSANDTNKVTYKTATQPVVTKGYYSIYKNADKLNHSNPLINISARSNETGVTQPEKGYYSMNNHHKKIYKSGVSFIAKKHGRPVAVKGYYNMSMPANGIVLNKKSEADSVQVYKTDSAFVMIPQ